MTSAVRVYPRAYGATRSISAAPEVMKGLSPCIQGYLEVGGRAVGHDGSISVCTGLPICRTSTAAAVRVYSRVCGATESYDESSISYRGLSPYIRAPCIRGYYAPGQGGQGLGGSIPVCTGLPVRRRGIRGPPGVYPYAFGATDGLALDLRVWGGYPNACGATTLRDEIRSARGGLSPRMWGYRVLGDRREFEVRSIPTHVGLPQSRRASPNTSGVYPHACGVTLVDGRTVQHDRGLSPRMWGYPSAVDHVVVDVGSIPVCTGLPRPRTWRYPTGRVYPSAYGATMSTG